MTSPLMIVLLSTVCWTIIYATSVTTNILVRVSLCAHASSSARYISMTQSICILHFSSCQITQWILTLFDGKRGAVGNESTLSSESHT